MPNQEKGVKQTEVKTTDQNDSPKSGKTQHGKKKKKSQYQNETKLKDQQ